VNSLARSGFRGNVWAGYRGDLPPWFTGKKGIGQTEYFEPIPGIRIGFVPVRTELHFAQYKPDFCLQVLHELDSNAEGVFYFDPDVFILAEWKFFETWLGSGIAACEDGHYPLNPSHPLVKMWSKYLSSKGFALSNPINAYMNSGLAGVRRDASAFLELWRNLLIQVQQDFKTGGLAHFGNRTDLFHNIDQDAFTLALSITSLPVSPVGVDGMGFAQGEWLTLHATGRKPWRRRIFSDLLREGVGIDRALLRYWEFCEQPVFVERRPSPFFVLIIRLITRFYGRK